MRSICHVPHLPQFLEAGAQPPVRHLLGYQSPPNIYGKRGTDTVQLETLINTGFWAYRNLYRIFEIAVIVVR